MNKLLLVALLPLALLGQEKNNIKVNTIGLFNDYYEFKYERVISKKSSYEIGYGTGTYYKSSGEKAKNEFSEKFGHSTSGNYEHITSGYNISAYYKYYFSQTRDAPFGPNIGLGINYLNFVDQYTNESDSTQNLNETNYSLYNLGLTFGFQFNISNLIINPFVGAGLFIGEEDNNPLKGSMVSFGVDAGFLF